MALHDSSPPNEAPPVVDRRTTPAGVMPRHIQAWSLLGLAGLMTAVLVFSGPTQPTGPRPTPNPALQTIDPSRARIEQFQRQVENEAQRLAAERAEVELAKRAMRDAMASGATSLNPAISNENSHQGTAAPADTLGQERVQRDYRSLFVDSVVWSARALRDASSGGSAPTPSTLTSSTEAGSRMNEPPSGDLRQSPSRDRGIGTSSAASTESDGHVLREGTVLDAVLLNRLDGQFVGPVNAMVTLPAYSSDREHVLIPQGTRLLGEARAVEHREQTRLAVFFHRLLLPNGTAVSLDQVRGLNQVGDSGLHDQVDRHYWQVFGSALAIGALGGLAQGYAYGSDPSSADVYARGVANTFGQSATHVLDRFLNVLPTVTIREGHRLRVYLSRDLLLPSAERVTPVATEEVP